MFYNDHYAHCENCLHHSAPDLLAKAQDLAQREHRTMSELFREALRRYMQGGDAGWEALLGRTRAQGRALGIATEADVERRSDEYRRHRR